MPDTKITYNVPDGVDWDFGTAKTDGGWLAAQDGIVDLIVLGSTQDNLALETVVAAYGFPNVVVPDDCRYGMCSTTLVYADLGMWLNVFIENKGWNNNSV